MRLSRVNVQRFAKLLLEKRYSVGFYAVTFRVLCCTALFGCLINLQASEPTAPPKVDPESLQFFETRVRPVLLEHCDNCHGAKKQWGSLRLDSLEALLKGGETGPAIVPGKPDESLLIKAIRHEDENLQMPQDGKLTDVQIADLVRWVELGAPFPEVSKSGKPNRDPNHWAFQPPQPQGLPAVSNTSWPRNEIDHFILAKLEANGLQPAAAADKRTFIRRVTFDLIGLPPTPTEVEAFVADESPEAETHLIDRLLESPAYGEKWGRHWLDIARYADSNGLDENVAHGNAWRYRDYVVSSFNRDKPIDQFISEQLAGDLLPAVDSAQRDEFLTATGFIAIGPKVLAETNTDKMKMDIIDEQIDTVGRVFLGMTLGCARCHDHKFDPINTADYYGLAGIFKSTRTMDDYNKVAKWHENNLNATDAQKAAVNENQTQRTVKKELIDVLVAGANKLATDKLAPGSKAPENLETLYSESIKAELAKHRDELAQLEKNAPELPSAMGVTEDSITNVAVHVRGNPSKLGDIVPRHTLPVVKGPQSPEFTDKESGRRELAKWLTNPQHPLTSRVLVNRIWRWHFGQGIVRTADNFGLLGEAPSHPELLDWLALKMVSEGWSMKKMHRLILLSSTYRQASEASAETLAKDPENQLFGHANLHRLEAEELRDALLAVSGRLDLQMGGSLLQVKNRGYLFDHTSIDKTDYSSTRRALYLPVIRNNVYDFFQLLDFPDPAVPSGNRATTTVAPQALLMMNSDLVMQCAEGLATRLLGDSMDQQQRINQMYALTYGRNATSGEVQENLNFLAQIDQATAATESDVAKRQLRSWSILCQTILASNEFIYLR